MEMGVFDALPLDKSSVTATALSKQLDVEKDLLGEFLKSISVLIRLSMSWIRYLTNGYVTVRLMRVLTISGPFAEVGLEEYSHTPYSLVYMAPALRGIFKSM